jgi:hypothetical protein
MNTSLAKAWVVRAFLERDDLLAPPEEIGFWLYPDLDGFQRLDLPRDVLEKIYRATLSGCTVLANCDIVIHSRVVDGRCKHTLLLNNTQEEVRG